MMGSLAAHAFGIYTLRSIMNLSVIIETFFNFPYGSARRCTMGKVRSWVVSDEFWGRVEPLTMRRDISRMCS